jgi:histidine triad (HIT) family protein
MEDCLFCKIIKGDIPSYTIYEDDLCKVFLDINPTVNGHLLIVSKNHVINILDLDEETLLHIHKISKKMYSLLEEKLNITGLTMLHNSGSAQQIKHFHLHLIPQDKFNESEKKVILPIEEIFKQLK